MFVLKSKYDELKRASNKRIEQLVDETYKLERENSSLECSILNAANNLSRYVVYLRGGEVKSIDAHHIKLNLDGGFKPVRDHDTEYWYNTIPIRDNVSTIKEDWVVFIRDYETAAVFNSDDIIYLERLIDKTSGKS